MKETFIKTL